jgi:hypothetical protein
MIYWGVWLDEEVVVRCYDGPSAFREEEIRQGLGWHRAQVVVSRDGVVWRMVPWESSVRPDPCPPRRASVRPASTRGWRRVCEVVFRWLGVGMRPDSVRVVGPWRRRV